MKGFIILAAVLVALLLATAAGVIVAFNKIGELQEKEKAIYKAIDLNNSRALRRCSDLEGRCRDLERRCSELETWKEETEKKLESGEYGDAAAIEKAVAKGMDNIFNYSWEKAMSGGKLP